MGVITKLSLGLLDDFAEAAKVWGWQEDQGVGRSVDRSRQDYHAAYRALRHRLAYLERQLERERRARKRDHEFHIERMRR